MICACELFPSIPHPPAQNALAKLLLFNKLDPHLQRKVVQEMYERNVGAGEILIKEGDTGLAATELYVTKSGKFEVSLSHFALCNAMTDVHVGRKDRADMTAEITSGCW